MLLSEESWIIEVLTVHLEVRIPEEYHPLTEDELDWNWHHWKKIESLLRYPEPYYARELTRIVLEINEAVNGTKERLYGDQRDFIIWERVFHDMESAAIGGAFVITRVPEKRLPKLQGTAVAPHLKPQDSVDEKLTFIGVILKDQDDEPVVNSRVRIKLPDGDIKNGRTNAAGEVMVKGFALDGMAEIELLDFCDPGEAEAVEEEEQPAEEEQPSADETVPAKAEPNQWVSFELVDQFGQSVPDREYSLELSDKQTRNGTSEGGTTKVEGIPDGDCMLQFTSIEEEAFSDPSKGSGRSSPSKGGGSVSGTTHVVADGEHLGSVAAKYGFERMDTIWNAFGNAPLRSRRSDPCTLAPGDTLSIPDKKPNSHSLKPGKHHRITVWRQYLKLKLRLLDFGGVALSNTPCDLSIDGAQMQLTTDPNGILETDVPFNAQKGTLEAAGIQYELAFGALGPASDPLGLENRLKNLGFYLPGGAESPGNGNDPEKMLALELLQARQGLTVDGQLTDDTIQAIQKAYGC